MNVLCCCLLRISFEIISSLLCLPHWFDGVNERQGYFRVRIKKAVANQGLSPLLFLTGALRPGWKYCA
jgi:hypothetical protein